MESSQIQLQVKLYFLIEALEKALERPLFIWESGFSDFKFVFNEDGTLEITAKKNDKNQWEFKAPKGKLSEKHIVALEGVIPKLEEFVHEFALSITTSLVNYLLKDTDLKFDDLFKFDDLNKEIDLYAETADEVLRNMIIGEMKFRKIDTNKIKTLDEYYKHMDSQNDEINNLNNL